MDEGLGNMELLPREGCENPKNLRRVDSNVTGARGLEGQEGKSSKSIHTLYEVDGVQEKGKVMYAKKGIMSLAPSKESDSS